MKSVGRPPAYHAGRAVAIELAATSDQPRAYRGRCCNFDALPVVDRSADRSDSTWSIRA